MHACMHTHTRLTGPLTGTTRVSWYQKGKTNLDLLEQEIMSGSGISWAICKSTPRPRQITMPGRHHSVINDYMCIVQAPCHGCVAKIMITNESAISCMPLWTTGQILQVRRPHRQVLDVSRPSLCCWTWERTDRWTDEWLAVLLIVSLPHRGRDMINGGR